MKRICKATSEPQALTAFRSAKPSATWDDAYKDKVNGKRISQICRRQTLADQYNLCAYCESQISFTDSRIEHFHSKSDTSQNWALKWENMLAVCEGGSKSADKTTPRHAKLHCDAHKNHQVMAGVLAENCDGWILNPLNMHALQNLFTIDRTTGCLHPDTHACASIAIADNKYATTEELVQNTIDNLNLNATPLCALRQETCKGVEQFKHILRSKITSPQEYRQKLAERFFGKKWPAFFTTIRCCLGEAAETYLASINYQG